MKSLAHGTSISSVEVLNISQHGVWLAIKGKEYFLSYEHFPWFQDARVAEIRDVRLTHGHLLRWESLDVDLPLDTLEHPERYPLKYQLRHRTSSKAATR